MKTKFTQFITSLRVSALVVIMSLFSVMAIAQLPFTETFDGSSTPTGWTQSATSGGPWVFGNYSTNYPGYDNRVDDHTGNSGYYTWLDYSSSNDVGVVLASPVITVTTNTVIMAEYYVYSYYASTSAYANWLYFETFDGTNWNTIDSSQQNVNGWVKYTYDISSSKYSGTSLQFRFRGEMGSGGTSSFYNDILIDDIRVWEPVPNNMAMIEWVSPLSGTTPSATTPITVKFRNAGTAAQSGFALKYSIDGGTTIISETYAGTVSAGDTITYTFNATANMATPGYYDCGAAVISTGDPDGTNDSIFARPYLCQSLSGVFTLGPDSADDFNNIADLGFALGMCGVSGPVTVNVDAGTYVGNAVFTNIAGASATNNIIIQSASGLNTDVVFEYTGGSTYEYTIHFDGASYITLQDVTVKLLGTNNYNAAIYSGNGAHHIVIDDNIIEATNSGSSSGPRAIESKASNYITISNNTFLGGAYGMYIYGNSNSDWEKGHKILNNDVSGFGYGGIYAYYQDSIEVKYNYVHGQIGASTLYGIALNYGFNGFDVSFNNIALEAGTSSAYGLRIYYGNYATYTAGNEAPGYVYNNFVSIGGTSTSSNYGLYAYYCDKVNYYYNSISITAGGSSSRALYQYNTTATNHPVGQRFINNIFSNTAGGYSAYFGSTSATSAPDSADYNVYYSTGSNFAYWGSNKSDFASMLAASGQDANSMSFDPGFVSSSDLHVNNAMIDGAAMPIAMVSTDIDGDARTATPDIGADEFVVITDDAGVVAINGVTGICPGSSATVMAEVKNFGVDTLYSFTINWEANGVGQTAVPVMDTLAPLEIKEYTTGTFLVAANTVNSFKAWTTIPNGLADMKTDNDTLMVTGIEPSMPGGTYVIGASATADFATFDAAVTAMNANGICGAVVFNIESGTYYEHFAMGEILGASATNTITFKSLSGVSSDVTLTYTSGDRYDYTILLDGADWVTIQDISVEFNSTYGTLNYCSAIRLTNGADHNNIMGNQLKALSSSSGEYPLEVRGGINSYNTMSNNIVIGGYYAVYVYGGGSTSLAENNVIENNDVSEFSYYGIYGYYQDSLQVVGNKVHSPSSSAGGLYGIYVGYTFNGFNVANNEVKLSVGSSTTYGLRMYYCNYNTYATGNEAPGYVYNNMISLYGNNNSGNYGLYAYYGDKVEYYFNSVNVSAGSTSARAMYRSGNAGNTVGQTFKNNVFSCTTGGHAAYFNNTTSLVASDYNVYWTDTVANSNFIYKSGNNVTIGDFITATNLDSNSLQANPGFISEMDLHKSPASPNDMGTPIAMITTDIDGDTRKALTPDQGADEWDQPANDITLTSFVSPVSALCGDLAADVKVIVYNLGTNAQTSIPVTVMGSGPSGAINLTYNIPSMASGFVDTVTVGTISTLAAGTYNLKAYSTLSTDMEPNNDTITTMVEIEDAIAVPFIEDFSSNMYNWKTSQYMTIGTSTHGYTSDMMFSNLYGSRVHEHFELDGKVGTVPSDAYFVFDYRIVDYASGNPATILNADSMIVSMSGDCQSTWSEIYVIDTNTHIPSQNMQTIMLPLTAFAGNDVSFRFDLHYDQGDYWVNFDNIAIVTPPMVNLGPDTSFCGGSMITLDAGNDSSYMMSYMWTDLVSGDTLGYGQMLDVDSSMTIVAMIANQFGMMDYDTIMTTVYAPTAVSFTGLAASYCDNEMAATLVGTPTTGTFMGAGITGTSFDPMAAGQGNHMITYTIVDANMCTYMTMDSTMVYAAPAATMSADATICEGDSTMLSVSGQVAVPAEQSMIFSVYIEGTSNNKAIEVFNTTGATLNLDNYRIAQATNGNGWQYYHTFPAGATLAAYSSWVMITDQTDTNMYNPALADEVLSYPSLVHHNGDDARGIEVTTDGGTTWTLIDLIGDPNNDPGSAWDVAGVTNATANHTMVRKSNVMSGDTNWIAVAGTDSLSSQYMVYPVNSFNLLDSHVMDMTAANLTYLWSNGATTADVYVMPTSTTTYTVTVSNGNCTEMGSVEITVNPIPMVNLGADQMIKWTAGSVMLDAGNAGATYLWNTGATTQTETFDNTNLTNGMVNVVYVDVTENGCTGSDTVLIDVMDDVSINGALSNVSMNVYPNPNSGNFTMTIEGFNGEMNMEIVNLSGQVVYTETLNTQAGFVADFDMSALSTGVYYIRLSSNNGVKVHKLVIK